MGLTRRLSQCRQVGLSDNPQTALPDRLLDLIKHVSQRIRDLPDYAWSSMVEVLEHGMATLERFVAGAKGGEEATAKLHADVASVTSLLDVQMMLLTA